MHRPQTQSPTIALLILYSATFFFGLHIALPIYSNSSFLGNFFSETVIGFIYGISSLITFFAIVWYPRILRLWGNYKTTIAILCTLTALSLVLTAQAASATPSNILILVLFIILQVLLFLGMYNYDVFLEHYSKEKTTGALRGLLLSVVSLAVLSGPLFAGVLIGENEYWRIFLFSSFMLLPVFLLTIFGLRLFKDPVYDQVPFTERAKQVFFARHPNDNLRHATIANFLMRFFYSWMIIYTPLYLHSHIGFSWEQLGVIFPIMLLPFVLFEYPIGRLLDKRRNERTVMILGFAIAAVFTGSLFFVREASMIVWTTLLFLTRVGISLVETSSESYFFRHIGSADTEILSVFRNTNPVAWLLGPLSAAAVLTVFPLEYLFLILSAVLCLGVWISARMNRTT